MAGIQDSTYGHKIAAIVGRYWSPFDLPDVRGGRDVFHEAYGSSRFFEQLGIVSGVWIEICKRNCESKKHLVKVFRLPMDQFGQKDTFANDDSVAENVEPVHGVDLRTTPMLYLPPGLLDYFSFFGGKDIVLCRLFSSSGSLWCPQIPKVKSLSLLRISGTGIAGHSYANELVKYFSVPRVVAAGEVLSISLLKSYQQHTNSIHNDKDADVKSNLKIGCTDIDSASAVQAKLAAKLEMQWSGKESAPIAICQLRQGTPCDPAYIALNSTNSTFNCDQHIFTDAFSGVSELNEGAVARFEISFSSASFEDLKEKDENGKQKEIKNVGVVSVRWSSLSLPMEELPYRPLPHISLMYAPLVRVKSDSMLPNILPLSLLSASDPMVYQNSATSVATLLKSLRRGNVVCIIESADKTEHILASVCHRQGFMSFVIDAVSLTRDPSITPDVLLMNVIKHVNALRHGSMSFERRIEQFHKSQNASPYTSTGVVEDHKKPVSNACLIIKNADLLWRRSLHSSSGAESVVSTRKAVFEALTSFFEDSITFNTNINNNTNNNIKTHKNAMSFGNNQVNGTFLMSLLVEAACDVPLEVKRLSACTMPVRPDWGDSYLFKTSFFDYLNKRANSKTNMPYEQNFRCSTHRRNWRVVANYMKLFQPSKSTINQTEDNNHSQNDEAEVPLHLLTPRCLSVWDILIRFLSASLWSSKEVHVFTVFDETFFSSLVLFKVSALIASYNINSIPVIERVARRLIHLHSSLQASATTHSSTSAASLFDSFIKPVVALSLSFDTQNSSTKIMLNKASYLHSLQTKKSKLQQSRQNALFTRMLKNLNFNVTDKSYSLQEWERVFDREHNNSLISKDVKSNAFDSVGGMEHAKKAILDVIQLPLTRRELFAGASVSGGILLFGPPGTGKTLLAKAVASACNVHFISVKGPELLSPYIGESEANVRRVFREAREKAPCVVFFDEVDSLAPARGSGGDSAGVMDRVVAQLLGELDACSSSGEGVFSLFATNRPDLLDSSLLRPGRVDKMVYIGIPENKEGLLTAQTRNMLHESKTLCVDGNGQSKAEFIKAIAQKVPKEATGADCRAVVGDATQIALLRRATMLKTLSEEVLKVSVAQLQMDLKTAEPYLNTHQRVLNIIQHQRKQRQRHQQQCDNKEMVKDDTVSATQQDGEWVLCFPHKVENEYSTVVQFWHRLNNVSNNVEWAITNINNFNKFLSDINVLPNNNDLQEISGHHKTQHEEQTIIQWPIEKAFLWHTHPHCFLNQTPDITSYTKDNNNEHQKTIYSALLAEKNPLDLLNVRVSETDFDKALQNCKTSVNAHDLAKYLALKEKYCPDMG